MLPHYVATEFKGVLEGGTTFPWKVVVADPKRPHVLPREFVVKLFSEKQVEAYQPVAHEVYGALLAREFDLATPDSALITFPDFFLATLPSEHLERLQRVDARPKFGSAYLAGAPLLTAQIARQQLTIEDMATVYAFDNLLRHTDRRREKPNMLLLDSQPYLIDHETVLSISDGMLKDWELGEWRHHFRRHVFFSHLRVMASRKTDAQVAGWFDTAAEMLRYARFEKVEQVSFYLAAHGHPVGNTELALRYLRIAKADPSRFVRLLVQTLR